MISVVRQKIIYTASGTLNNNATFGCFDWVNRKQSTNTDSIIFAATTELPVPFNNRFVIGARSPTNDNWIAGKFYGRAIIGKKINDNERNVIEDFLYINTYM